MNIRIWGCRGSLPAPGPEKNIYGGNTSCVQITHDNTCIILDGGSGLLRLGESLPKNFERIDILLTHLHLDHIIGLGFFTPIYNPKMTVNIWGPSASNESLRNRLRKYFSPPIFPMRLKELPCMGEVFEIDDSDFSIGDFKIKSEYICHPGPTVGYRIQLSDAVFAYLPDHEPVLGSCDFPNNPDWTSGYNLAQGADLLFHDAQYKNEVYEHRIGWGHSAMKDAIDFAELSKVKRLALFHHDPAHSDHQLEYIFHNSIKDRKLDFEVTLAKEGQTFEL